MSLDAQNQTAVLEITEKLNKASNRKRRVKVTAESVTLGTNPKADIELTRISSDVIVEIKTGEDGKWWIINSLQSEDVRVNGRLVQLDHALNDKDQILVSQHTIIFEIPEVQKASHIQSYRFLPQPTSDELLWKYLQEQNEFDEVLINGKSEIFVDWQGNLIRSPWSFSTSNFLEKKIFEKTKAKSGWFNWIEDRTLRIHGSLPPITDQAHVCIRKARQNVFSLNELLQRDFGTADEINFLKSSVATRKNILISGGTSTGKTVLLRSLVEQITSGQRVIVLEEEAETNWPHPHCVSIEAGKGSLRQGLIESLRMRPDRLIVSEIRGTEAYDFLQAINTGHEGSMTTLHANSPREALYRLENLILQTANYNDPLSIRRQIAQSIQVIVQLTRETNGTRKIESIAQITGIQAEVISLTESTPSNQLALSQDLKIVR